MPFSGEPTNPPEIRAALDTSVVMRLLIGQPLELAAAARSFMAEIEQAGAKVYVSNLVVMEAYFACQHHYGMTKADVLGGLLFLFSMPTFIVHPQLTRLLSMRKRSTDGREPGVAAVA